MSTKPRYKDRSKQKFYENLLALAYDRSSELYYNGAQHRGAGHRCAFWDGFDGLERSANVIPDTLSAVAFQAGKEFACRSKAEGIAPPIPAATPYFAGKPAPQK